MERLRFKEEELQLFIEIDKKIEENPDNMKLHDERENRINQSITRTIREYGGNIQAFHNDIKHEAEKIAKSYNGFPWEHLKEWPALGTPKEVIKNGILAILNVYLDYISERDTDGYNDLMNHVDMIATQYAKRAWSATQDVTEAPTKRGKFPSKFERVTDQQSRLLFNGEPVTSDHPLMKDVSQLSNQITINFDDLEGIPAKFTRYDKEIYTAIVNRYIQGERVLTSQQIHQTIAGNNKLRITRKKAMEYDAAIKKGMASLMTIDRTATASRYPGIKRRIITGNVLEVKAINEATDESFNGYYKILDLPVWFQDAQEKNQVTSVPTEVLKVIGSDGKTLETSEDVIILRGYLVDWIQALKNPKNKQKNPERTYHKFYDLLKIDETMKTRQSARDKKSDTRKKILEILDHFATVGYIESYKEFSKGRAKHKIRISLRKSLEGENMAT